MIGGPVSDDLGYPDLKVITPGDHLMSSLWLRMESIEPGTMMPPLAKHTADLGAMDLVQAWIDDMGEKPRVTHPGDQRSPEGDVVALQLEAYDPQGDPLTCLAAGLPPGLSMDDFGLMSGTIPGGSIGSYKITVTVSDGDLEDSVNFVWTVTAGIILEYPNFSDLSAWQLEGSAAQVTDVLRLSGGGYEAGTAFYKTPWSLSADTSFSSRFDFRIHGAEDGGDGMTFMIQGSGPDSLGRRGSRLGYSGISPSVAVEIDNVRNANVGDPNANHIAVLANGRVADRRAVHTPSFDLEDGASDRMWVDYDGPSSILAVYLAPRSGAKPDTPIITYPVDLSALIGSQAYVGFSSGNGSLSNNTDVENRSFAIDNG